MTAKDNVDDVIVQQKSHVLSTSRTRTLLTGLCIALVYHELLFAMVLGAPSYRKHGLLTNFRFTYNTTDTYVDRVCRRAPVLLEPGASLPCRIVDKNCIVDDPCVGPDPVNKLLDTAPCPPVWNPALLFSSDIGAKLECSEKFEIFWKCFLSPNRTLYDLTTQTESCKLKRTCDEWLMTCPDERSRLSDVFVNCAEATTESTSSVSSVDRSTDMSHTTYKTNSDMPLTAYPTNSDKPLTTYPTNSDKTINDHHDVVPTVDRFNDMPSKNYTGNNATNPVFHMPATTFQGLEMTENVPDDGYAVPVLWAVTGVLLPGCSMIILFFIFKRKHSRRQKMCVNKRNSGLCPSAYNSHVEVTEKNDQRDIDASFETTPFLADDPEATGKSLSCNQDTGNNSESKLETEKPGVATALIILRSDKTQKQTGGSELTSSPLPEISLSKTETENELENITESIPTDESPDAKSANAGTNLETENPGTLQNNVMPVNSDHKETNLVTENPGTTQNDVRPVNSDGQEAHSETNNPGIHQNNLVQVDHDHEKTNLETEDPGIPRNNVVPIHSDHEQTNLETMIPYVDDVSDT